MPTSSVIVAASVSRSASRMSATRRIFCARSANDVLRCSRNASCASRSLSSNCASVSGVKVWMVSPVAGLMVAMGIQVVLPVRPSGSIRVGVV